MTPMQLSLRHMRKQGYLCAITEHWNPYTRHRQDLFGMFDFLAIRENEIIGVQTTSAGALSSHRRKIEICPSKVPWLRSGGQIVLHGWRKIQKPQKRSKYVLKEEVYKL